MKTEFSQNQAPLFEELLRCAQRPLAPFHTPGHKRGAGLEPEWFQSDIVAKIDLTEISAFDWWGALEKAQMLAANFFDADLSFFLTQGASQGIIGALTGIFAPGDKILVSRNCHLSVIKGITIAGLTPIFIETDYLPEWGIPGGLKKSALRAKIKEHPDYKGLLITNPTYQGIANRIRDYRELSADRILLVDEAHGGHLEWSGISGYNAYEGADLWIHGTHKMMGSFTQTGMLHVNTARIEPDQLQQGLDLITTTSPSYVLLASLDSNRRFLAEKGRRLFRERLPELMKVRSRIAACDGARILEGPLAEDRVIDPWKITLNFNLLGLTGYQAAHILETDFRIQPEYADLNQVTLLIGPWQDRADLEALYQAVTAISKRKQGKIAPINWMPPSIPAQVIPVRDGVFASKTWVSLEEAIGRVAANIIAPYPPGVPLLVPGELIGKDEVESIKQTILSGGIVRGLNSGHKIAVVKENR
ncbi:MAG: aminotransferase class I/II-fold pyridoxal phosphate-dependent enzyme [Firmicutes bacterium]|nr:aminotransferase class I/II-fold pyridoxal phosphate-dependent enzyme [Bacillota bacterium]